MGEDLLGLVLDVRRAKKQGPEGIARRQRERLGAMIALARTKSPYYERLYADLPEGTASVELLPTTDKKALMGAFDEWLTDRSVHLSEAQAFADDATKVGEPFHGHTLATTSGTSGTKGIFLSDRHALTVTQAIAVRAITSWLSFGDFVRIIASGGRMAMVMAKGGHFASAVGAAGIKRRLKEKLLQLSVHDPIPEIVTKLNEFRPALIAPYASIASLLATEQEEGRLHVHPVLLTLAAEGLAPEEYLRIARAFGAKVGNTYASTEVPFLSASCDHGWLHVNTDWATLEPVDASYKPVPKGHVSHTVLVSNLANRLQPVLRYDLGDSVVERPDPCPCGSPFPAIRVQGRTSDVVRLVGRDGQDVAMPPMVFSTLLDPVPGIDLYQVVQTAPDALRVRMRVSGDPVVVWRRVEGDMRDLLKRHGLEHLRLERGDEAPEQTQGGKVRPIIPFKPKGPSP
ncbi:MAG: phenylacetate--CoA ligase family protein [Devosia sp.]|uniref:phenylacetate--CoA ligase family protein n=1 Tax=Devosia sp. TaxID=1871048 RepID=UPI001AC4E7AA|nr:phenylacetate--CoA ligase family protein [Devosia sp.]MBN9318002.1 phenylacetate--CoA ligase family protein [Devosia sp.]